MGLAVCCKNPRCEKVKSQKSNGFPGSSWASLCILLDMDCKKAGVCLCLLLVAVEHCICVLKQRGKEKFEDLFYF